MHVGMKLCLKTNWDLRKVNFFIESRLAVATIGMSVNHVKEVCRVFKEVRRAVYV